MKRFEKQPFSVVMRYNAPLWTESFRIMAEVKIHCYVYSPVYGTRIRFTIILTWSSFKSSNNQVPFNDFWDFFQAVHLVATWERSYLKNKLFCEEIFWPHGNLRSQRLRVPVAHLKEQNHCFFSLFLHKFFKHVLHIMLKLNNHTWKKVWN